MAARDRVLGRLRRWDPELPPQRLLAASAVNWVGSGLFKAAVPVFLVRELRLPVALIGAAFSAGALLGIPLSLALGALADRVGRRRTLVQAYLVQAALYAMFPFLAGGRVGFFAVTVAVTAIDGSTPWVSQAVAADLTRSRARLRYMALQRTVVNVGIGIGALLAGIAIAVGTHATFVALVLLDALTYGCAALLVATLPAVRRQEKAVTAEPVEAGRMPVVGKSSRRLGTVIGCSLLDGVMSMYLAVLNTGLALWVAVTSAAPAAIVGPLYFLNTALVVALQVRTTSRRAGAGSGVRAERAAGLALFAACTAIGLAGDVPETSAILLLVLGVVALTVGEMEHSSVSWQLSFHFTGERTRARGLATYGLGKAAAQVAGPLVVALVAGGGHAVIWLGLGSVFLIAAVALAQRMTTLNLDRPRERRGSDVDVEPATAG